MPERLTCTNATTTIWDIGLHNFLTSSDITETWTEDTVTLVDTESAWSVTVTYNPCSPFLYIPSRIMNLDPKWNTCSRDLKGLHDPPVVLTTAAGFSAVTQHISEVPHPTKTNSLSPAQAVQQPSVTKTPPPEAVPITSKLPVFATIRSSTITANSNSALVFGTDTLTPGGNVVVSGTALSMAADGATLIIDGTSTQVLEQPYTIIMQSFASGGSLEAVYGVSVNVRTDNEGGAEDTSVSSHRGISKATTSFGATKTSNAKCEADGQANSSVSLRKIDFSYWITWTAVLCIAISVL
jgi:hypothetical protein